MQAGALTSKYRRGKSSPAIDRFRYSRRRGFSQLIITGSFSERKNSAQDGVFKCFGWSQAHNRASLNLNSLAGLWIAAHTRLAMRLNCPSQIGDDELSCAALAFFNGQFK